MLTLSYVQLYIIYILILGALFLFIDKLLPKLYDNKLINRLFQL